MVSHHFGDHHGFVLCQDTRWQLWILKKNLCLKYEKLLLLFSQVKQFKVQHAILCKSYAFPIWLLIPFSPQTQIRNIEARRKRLTIESRHFLHTSQVHRYTKCIYCTFRSRWLLCIIVTCVHSKLKYNTSALHFQKYSFFFTGFPGF